VYLILVPFYLLGKTPAAGRQHPEGGVPQLADYFMVALMGLVLGTVPARLARPAVHVVGAFACFVCYAALVNFAWAASLEDLSLLKSSLFYAYDCALFMTCLVLYAAFKDRFLKATVYAVGASVVLQALISPLATRPTSDRQAVFFNDENQLGYYCVLAATILVLGARRFAIGLRYQLPWYVAVAYLAVISQCRAALAGLAVLAVVAVLGRPVRLVLALAALAAIYVIVITPPPPLAKSEERLISLGEYDTPATRGYDRILNYPEHLLFGAGEGAYERFRSELYASEIHSGPGTLLFCYGLVGVGLFACGLGLIVKGDPAAALWLLPAFVHGVAHQGLRFTFFWTMLGFVCCVALATPRPARARGAHWLRETRSCVQSWLR
jgi:hypothetical protein